MSLLQESIRSLHRRLSHGEITATDILSESFANIKARENKVKAFISIDEEGARERANELDRKSRSTSEWGLLAAIPTGIKDNICYEGMTMTCGSQLLANYDPIYNATVVNRLAKAEAITVGKMNMDEFAMGSSTENSSFHPTYNPWDETKVPGGSSGGTAAAVAAREVCLALGSDTGGSIRQPASYCGVVGLKPTYGRVSRYGLVAFASSLDQIGPLTKNVEDAAIALQVLAGYDAQDSTSIRKEVPDYLTSLTGEVKGLKIAVPKEMMGDCIDQGVCDCVKEGLNKLEKLGAYVEEVSLPYLDYAVASYYIIAPAEASSNLARFDGVRYGVRKEGKDLIDLYLETRSQGFGREVKRRIMLGTYALSSGYYDAYYLKAQKVRTLIKQDFDRIFNDFNVVIGPTTPTTAFSVGEKSQDPLLMYLNDICTIPVNLAGLPAISVPCGLSEGLPVGLQIIGKQFDEATILQVAHAFEQAQGTLQAPGMVE